LLVVFLLCFNIYCKKSVPIQSSSASLIIVNAVAASNPLYTNFTGSGNAKIAGTLQFYATALKIGYGSYTNISSYSGPTSISISQTTDSLLPLFKGELNLAIGSIQTLFLMGDTTAVDTLFSEDYLPYHSSTDSTFDIRFVNLSKGSNPVSIDIKGGSIGSEVVSLPYKGLSSFRNYGANSSAPSTYVFECRDAVTGVLLSNKTTYTINGIRNGSGANTSNNAYRFRNFTIALIGTPSTSGSTIQKLILINNY
jgi:hypothetical protein